MKHDLARAAPWLLLSSVAMVASAVLTRSKHRSARVVREFLLLFSLVIVYFVARGLAAARPTQALDHAYQIITLEKQFGIFYELQLQRLALGYPALLDFGNWTYIWGHWPVLVAIVVWLGINHPGRLPVYRNAMILSGAIGIAIFIVYPVAPPRFLSDLGFVDTVALRSRAYRVLQPPALADLFASMPSLHLGWDLLMGIALVREASHTGLRLLGVLLPCAMLVAIVVTANHFFLDALAGSLIVTGSLLAVTHWRRPASVQQRSQSNRR